MADGTPEWPNVSLRVQLPSTILMMLATIFLVWRLVYGFRSGRRLMLCDYLLILAQMMNIVDIAFVFVLTDAGLGRHFSDPSIGLAEIMRYAYYLWITQIMNIVAVAVLKWSICAYLLVLDFSKLYRWIVWASILMITVFNFFMPVLTLFGCSPFRANWDRSIVGKCWAKGTLPLSYLQGVSNIITDVMYAVAPIVYLFQVQLSKRTQWGLRTVFLLSIIGTVCSIFKTIELKQITKTADPTWDGVDLSIWSSAELSVGIFIACLPPLRKPFDRIFKRLLPSTLTNSTKTPAYGYGRSTNNRGDIRMNTFTTTKGTKSTRPAGESVLDRDDESERAILEDDEHKNDVGGGITKTTQVTVMEENDRGHGVSPSGSYKNESEWTTSSDPPRGPYAV